jgi:hypothetical protein
VVCTLDENHFNNKTTIQLRVIDIRQTADYQINK